jgi:hypothetical protein
MISMVHWPFFPARTGNMFVYVVTRPLVWRREEGLRGVQQERGRCPATEKAAGQDVRRKCEIRFEGGSIPGRECDYLLN